MTTAETSDIGGYRCEISRKPPIRLWQLFWSCDPGMLFIQSLCIL